MLNLLLICFTKTSCTFVNDADCTFSEAKHWFKEGSKKEYVNGNNISTKVIVCLHTQNKTEEKSFLKSCQKRVFSQHVNQKNPLFQNAESSR